MTAKNPTHPSASIRIGLAETGWSVNQFAHKLGLSPDTAAQLLNGQRSISPAIAQALERIGWSDAEFWLRRQANYDLAQARRETEPETAPRPIPPA